MPMNVKEFDNFFCGDQLLQLAIFIQILYKIVNFVFSSKMLNFAISFVFRPK